MRLEKNSKLMNDFRHICTVLTLCFCENLRIETFEYIYVILPCTISV